jgi:hypothetical protein
VDLQYATQHTLDNEYLQNIQATCGFAICFSTYSTLDYKYLRNIQYQCVYNMLPNILWIPSICQIFRLPMDLQYATQPTLDNEYLPNIQATCGFTICYSTYTGIRVFTNSRQPLLLKCVDDTPLSLAIRSENPVV